MILAIIGAAIIGLLVWLVGSLFDPTIDNRYARFAGLGVFLLLVLVRLGFLN